MTLNSSFVYRFVLFLGGSKKPPALNLSKMIDKSKWRIYNIYYFCNTTYSVSYFDLYIHSQIRIIYEERQYSTFILYPHTISVHTKKRPRYIIIRVFLCVLERARLTESSTNIMLSRPCRWREWFFKRALERTIGSGWQRVRQTEGRVCVWVCVQGLRGSKASHFRVLMLTQPP